MHLKQYKNKMKEENKMKNKMKNKKNSVENAESPPHQTAGILNIDPELVQRMNVLLDYTQGREGPEVQGKYFARLKSPNSNADPTRHDEIGGFHLDAPSPLAEH